MIQRVALIAFPRAHTGVERVLVVRRPWSLRSGGTIERVLTNTQIVSA
jgi:hypothetical protein